MKLFKNIFAAVIFLLSMQANANAAPIVAGTDYKLVEPAQATQSGNKIEVLEFFFYGCSHCFHLHPDLSAWEKTMPQDVDLVLVPTVFNPNWEAMAYTYYALEVLGLNHKLHHDLYEAWNVKNMSLTDENSTAAFLAKFGMDSKKFGDAYHSFTVQSKVTRSKQMTQAYGIRGTPTLIVDGRYLITGLQPADAVRVMNALVEKVRKERRAGKK